MRYNIQSLLRNRRINRWTTIVIMTRFLNYILSSNAQFIFEFSCESNPKWKPESCYSRYSYFVTSQLCDGKSHCDVVSSPYLFSKDNWAPVKKELTIVYTCVCKSIRHLFYCSVLSVCHCVQKYNKIQITCEGRLPTPLTECSKIDLWVKYIHNYSKSIRLKPLQSVSP